jgi:hypothetical protein
MKQTQRSFNSTLRRVSPKRAAQLIEYGLLKTKLLYLARGRSELSGKKGRLEPHHIDGRRGLRLVNPFNIIMITHAEHRWLQSHNTYEQRRRLRGIIRTLREKQGFLELCPLHAPCAVRSRKEEVEREDYNRTK